MRTQTPVRTPVAALRSEAATQRLDRLLHASAATVTRGLSPVSLSLAWADWAWHLALSPGRQIELAALAAQLYQDSWRAATRWREGEDAEGLGSADDDPRFRHPAWTQWPFSALRHGFRNQETFWREGAHMPGMTRHHAEETAFFARQWLGAMTPANWLPSNPVVLQTTLEQGGANLVRGALNAWHDLSGTPDPELQRLAARFVVGRDIAVTPGDVVFRNRLIELIRYAPQTETVLPRPLLIVPSWIMKYYILDLSPHNSLVRYLVTQGHTVYMLSWSNPGAEDAELSMDDYLQLGVFDALRAIAQEQGANQAVHAMGYCLGGTLLAIAAAAIARRGGCELAQGAAPLHSLTLLAAQTDFSDPGELGLFIDESQIGYLDQITRGQGYLSGEQMAGSFQFLHSRELVWSRRMREYLMGEREQPTDLMAWNADTTRLPARMHHEYLTALYLHNALATSSYRVAGQTISLADLHEPMFVVGTERDHISPWRSVYKLHHLCDAEITFVLTSGGHNAGIVSEPGHANRHYRIHRRAEHGPWISHEHWQGDATQHTGSWWPAWHRWLSARSGKPVPARRQSTGASLGPAPGRYVFVR